MKKGAVFGMAGTENGDGAWPDDWNSGLLTYLLDILPLLRRGVLLGLEGLHRPCPWCVNKYEANL